MVYVLSLIAALIGVCFLFWLQKWLYRKFWNNHLDVEVSFSVDYAVEGDLVYLYEEIRNEKILPLPMVKVKFTTAKELVFDELEEGSVTDKYYRNDILSTMMYQRVKRKLPIECSHRGFYTIEDIDIIGSDLFLSEFYAFHLAKCSSLIVCPKHLPLNQLQIPYQSIMGMVLSQQRIYQDPFEFAGIREYQSYDSMKMVNWKATAKTGNLQVNVKDYTANRSVKIILNLKSQFFYREKDMEEQCIRVASTLAAKLLADGVQVELESNGVLGTTKEHAKVPLGARKDYSRKIDEILALIDTNIEMDSVMELMKKKTQNKETVCVLISRESRAELQEIILQKQREGEGCYWIMPKYEEEEIQIKKEILPYFSAYDMKR